jgi:hypothetical protein
MNTITNQKCVGARFVSTRGLLTPEAVKNLKKETTLGKLGLYRYRRLKVAWTRSDHLAELKV